MRKVRIRELLLVVALVAFGLGWAIDHARLARSLTRSKADCEKRHLTLEFQFIELRGTLESVRRQLAECEGGD